MSSLVPATLALLGVGMFALSIWFQESGRPVARDVPQQPLPVPREPVAAPVQALVPEGEVLPVSAARVP